MAYLRGTTEVPISVVEAKPPDNLRTQVFIRPLKPERSTFFKGYYLINMKFSSTRKSGQTNLPCAQHEKCRG